MVLKLKKNFGLDDVGMLNKLNVYDNYNIIKNYIFLDILWKIHSKF